MATALPSTPDPSLGSRQSNVPTRGENTLVEAELAVLVAWLIRLRWIAGMGVVCAVPTLKVIFGLETLYWPFISIGVAILFYNLIFHIIERRLKVVSTPAKIYQRVAMYQVGLDWLAMILLFHFSGGIESPAIFFFIFHIIIASIFFTPRISFGFAILAVVLTTVTSLFEFFGIIPHRHFNGFIEASLHQNGMYVLAVLVFFNSTALISAYLVTSIQKRLRQREREVVQLTESLQRATVRLQGLNDSARIVSSTLNLSQVLNRMVKTTAEVMGVRACSIRLLDETGQHLEPEASYGLSQTYLGKGSVDVAQNPLARRVLAGEIVNLPEAQKSDLLQYPDFARQEGINSILSVPLIGKNGPLGLLRAYSEEVNRFTKDDETFLSVIAAQGIIAIENAMAYQMIADLDATKSKFVRMVTHELRSPVSVTRNLLQTITAGYAGTISDQQKDILERASRRVAFLQKLIDDLLDLATGKVERKTQETIEQANLDDVLSRVITRFQVPALSKQLSLLYVPRISNPKLIVNASIESLDRVFDNLVGNAVKYTPPNGKVTISLSTYHNEAQVTVEDTGIGIPENSMAHLFEEFYRAPNAKALEREGTGLGLTIVKDILNRLGGRISVQSTQGVGTCFVVAIPLIQE